MTVGYAGDVVATQLDLLRRLDPDASPPGSAEEIERQVRALVADRRLLLVVDDVWTDASAHGSPWAR